LPDSDRLEIAQRLLASVKPPGAMSEDDADLEAELKRRVARYKSEETQASPWALVRERAWAAIAEQQTP
jgi:putative addiction module component (TIGR02574 family)